MPDLSDPNHVMTPEEIAGDDFSFIDEIGLSQNLSPTRANGLVSMIGTIRQVAEGAL